jgi:prepilin signal peptidase PulO-like enzyme (type II secretory pathway)
VLTEAVLGTLFALAFGSLGLEPALPIMLAALVTLTFVVLYDLRHTVVPLAGSVLLFIFSFLFALLTSSGSPELGLSFLSAGLVALFLFLLYALSQGRAMGLGDAPVALSLALLVGGGQALAGLLFSFWIGALFGVAILLRRPGGPTMGLEVPFVPFMAAGFLLAYFTQWNPFPFFAL